MVDSEEAQTTTAPRQPRARVRRDVMAAAQHLLSTGNFAAFSVEALADVAGVSKATIYRWWKNRADVAMDVLLDVAGPNDPYVLKAGTALDNLREHILIASRFIGGRDGHMLAGIVADAQQDPGLAETFRTRYLDRRRSLIMGLMRDAQQSGELDADTDIQVLADLLIGPMYYRLLLGHGAIDPEYATNVFAAVIHPHRSTRADAPGTPTR